MKTFTLLLVAFSIIISCKKEELPTVETKEVLYEVLADSAWILYTNQAGDTIQIDEHFGNWTYSFDGVNGTHLFLYSGYNYHGIVTNVYVDGNLYATDTGNLTYQGDIDTLLIF